MDFLIDGLPENAWAFLLLQVVVCLTPGPAVLCVVAEAARRGARAGMIAALGINAANIIYYVLSATGLAAVIAASGSAFSVIKWIGAAYLAWLGVRAIRDSFRTQPGPSAPPAAVSSFRDAPLVQLANPKAILYFLALLPQFIDPARPIAGQVLILACIGLGTEMLVLTGYAFAGGAMSQALGRESVRRWFDRAIGGLLLGLSAMAAFARRAV